jgi:hypothetical protein
MASYDVFINSGVNVTIPDSVDPSTPEGHRILRDATLARLRTLLDEGGEIDLDYERYDG